MNHGAKSKDNHRAWRKVKDRALVVLERCGVELAARNLWVMFTDTFFELHTRRTTEMLEVFRQCQRDSQPRQVHPPLERVGGTADELESDMSDYDDYDESDEEDDDDDQDNQDDQEDDD